MTAKSGVRTPEIGIVVMAYGSLRYARQARSLAQSLDLNSPGIHRTLITDLPDKAPRAHYDLTIPIRGTCFTDCRPKLDLDLYTPYRYTLYLDSDSIVLRSLLPIFELIAENDALVIGRNITDGRWYGEVGAMRELAGSATLPQFNGGLIGFADAPRVHRVFDRARNLADTYEDLGFDRFNGGVADEPLLAIALAGEGIGACDRTSDVMATLLGISGGITLDVLAGVGGFEKRGRHVEPAVVHFAADYSSRRPLRGAHYRRERLKLTLAHRLGVRAATARAASIALHGAPCWLLDRALRRRSRRAGSTI